MGTAKAAGTQPNKGMIATLVLVSMLNIMGGAAIAPALPAMAEAFPEAGEALVSLVITLPSLAVAISGLFVGTLADKLGKVRTLAVSIVVFTITGLSGLFLPNLESILIARFVMGIAIAGIATSSGALVSESFEPEMRAQVFGWQNAATGASVLVLETTGGFLSLSGWRAPFLVYTVGIAFILMVMLFVRETPAAAGTPAAAAAGPAGSAEGGAEDAVRAGASAGAGTAARVVAISLAAAVLAQTLSYLVPSRMPYLVTTFGASSAVAGLFLGGFGIANIIGALVCAPLQQHLKRAQLAAICFGLLAGGCICMALATGMWTVLAGAVLMGAGVGCVTPLFMNWLASKSTAANSGKYMGAFATACNLGQFASSPLLGITLALFGTQQSVFAVGAVIGVAAAIGSLVFAGRIEADELAEAGRA